jgi:hypothetical protein
MLDKHVERAHQVPSVQDQQPVQALRPNRSNKPLRDPIRLRNLNRRPHNARALRLDKNLYRLARAQEKNSASGHFDC